MSSYLSIAQAAEYTNLSRAYIYRLVGTGKLAASKIGTVWRIKQADLEAFLQACQPN